MNRRDPSTQHRPMVTPVTHHPRWEVPSLVRSAFPTSTPSPYKIPTTLLSLGRPLPFDPWQAPSPTLQDSTLLVAPFITQYIVGMGMMSGDAKNHGCASAQRLKMEMMDGVDCWKFVGVFYFLVGFYFRCKLNHMFNHLFLPILLELAFKRH